MLQHHQGQVALEVPLTQFLRLSSFAIAFYNGSVSEAYHAKSAVYLRRKRMDGGVFI
jgi:hypothetical protein